MSWLWYHWGRAAALDRDSSERGSHVPLRRLPRDNLPCLCAFLKLQILAHCKCCIVLLHSHRCRVHQVVHVFVKVIVNACLIFHGVEYYTIHTTTPLPIGIMLVSSFTTIHSSSVRNYMCTLFFFIFCWEINAHHKPSGDISGKHVLSVLSLQSM